jgi:type IX secretion system substrate protein
MKKITFLFSFLLFGAVASAQCISADQYPTAPVVSDNDGSVQEITTCNYGGEYSVINGLIIGNNYQFTATGAAGNFITITDGSNTVIASGASPVSINSITLTSVRFHIAVDAACATDMACHTTSVQCTSPTCVPPPPPANDNLASAIAIACGNNYAGDTTLATLDEDSAPDGFGTDMDSPNVWYSFTGSGAAQTVTLDLCTASYDTSVAVYTGTTGNLTIIAGNDDGCGIQSTVSFASNGTSTYYIAVEGYNPTSIGTFSMGVSCSAVNPPAVANQTCATALAINVNGSTTNSNNSFGDVASSQPTCDTFGTIQDVWFSFVAPASGTVDCLLTNTTMTSGNFAVYSGACGGLTEVAGSCNSNITTSATESLTGLTAGNTYYVQAWSSAAEQGTFSIVLSDPTASADSFDTNSFRVYPNPVRNVLNLSYSTEISSVAVYNMLGQEVLSKALNAAQSQLDMSSLSSGNYIVKVNVDGLTKTIKVVKQ